MHKLLLADDSVTIQRVIELTFSGEDVQVVTVGDGEEAIARIPAERPDIILADIGMPKRNGYEVAAFVKGHPELAHIPVLLLAGAFEPVDQARAEEVKCDGVLVKPFEPQQVIARVRELVDGAKGSPARATAGVPRPIERLGPAQYRDSGSGIRDPKSPESRAPSPESRAPSPEPRAPSPESRVPGPEPRAQSPDPSTGSASSRMPARPPIEIPDAALGGGESARSSGVSDSLDDYFDRLDAAFASLGNAAGGGSAVPADSPMLDELAAHVEVPTIDDLLAGVPMRGVPGEITPPATRLSGPPVEPPDGTATMTPAPRAPAEPDAAEPDGGGARNVMADVFSALLAVEQGEPGAALRLPQPRTPVITDDMVDEVTRRVLERLAPAAAKDVVARIVSEVAERLVREEIARLRGGS